MLSLDELAERKREKPQRGRPPSAVTLAGFRFINLRVPLDVVNEIERLTAERNIAKQELVLDWTIAGLQRELAANNPK
jgi:hypothetical protein